jgi:hypothetical protein
MELQEVGQVFTEMRQTIDSASTHGLPLEEDFCPNGAQIAGLDGCDAPNGAGDSRIFPCEGFAQATGNAIISEVEIDPPRLANPMRAFGRMVPNSLAHGSGVTSQFTYMTSTFCGEWVDLTQVDPPAPPADVLEFGGRLGEGTPGSTAYCSPFFVDGNNCPTEPFGSFPPVGQMRVLGSGFYYEGILTDSPGTACVEGRFATPRPPFGCRILGQTTTQVSLGTTANRFASSISISGNHLLIGAPNRTARQLDVPTLPTPTRPDSGVVYMLPLHRPTADVAEFPYAVDSPEAFQEPGGPTPPTANESIPYPHNFIIKDLGYSRCNLVPEGPGHPWFDISHPLSIVGAAPGDKIGEVTGAGDLNNDGVPDFAVGGAGTNAGRGAVYVIYRRQPEVEGHYLLEQLQLSPADSNRLNGLMILGQAGENLGTAVAAGGALNDDFNDDGFADLLIGSPTSSPSAGLTAGQVFILFGGSNLLNPAGGLTLIQLRDSGKGMLLTGASAGDMTGMTVANAGDVDGDSVPDIVVSAPNATPRFDSNGDGSVTSADLPGMDLNGDDLPDDLDGNGSPDDLTGAGIVYVVFGGSHLTGTISLTELGTANLPGFMIAGRKAGDHLGGGLTQNNLPSRGIASAGDLDGDGRADLLISSVLADPEGKTDAGEAYLVYGVRP